MDWGEEGIECEQCFRLFHRQCVNMSPTTYSLNNDNPSLEWSCVRCEMSPFSTSSFEDERHENSHRNNNPQQNPVMEENNRPSLNSGKQKKSDLPKRPLRFLNVNCQSVRAKLPLFQAVLDSERPDVVVGTESWLDEHNY